MKRILIITAIIITTAGITAVLIYERNNQPAERGLANPGDVYAVLAIRSFRGSESKTTIGQNGSYSLSVGENFKVTWVVDNLTENGQLIYRGPAGIGSGLVNIPLTKTASGVRDFLEFTPKEGGTAVFTLTTTGKSGDSIVSPTTTITVEIK